MRTVIAIVLVTHMHTAAADPVAAPTGDCKPAGGVMFEIGRGVVRNAKLPTATTQLFENGAWRTEVIDVDGRLARQRSGCLEPTAVEVIRESLRAARWKLARSKATCRADQPRFTTYRWKRRLLFTDRTCNIDVLDEDSQHALDLVDSYLRGSLELDRGRIQPECLANPLAKGCT